MDGRPELVYAITCIVGDEIEEIRRFILILEGRLYVGELISRNFAPKIAFDRPINLLFRLYRAPGMCWALPVK